MTANLSDTRRRALFAGGATLVVIFLAVVALPAYLINRQSQAVTPRDASVSNVKGQVASPSLSSPARNAGVTRDADAQLAYAIDKEIDEGEFASARWGVHVVSLRDGRVLYARNAAQLFTPASNMKLYTTAVALDLLGADYHWRTSVYAAVAPDANGTVAGDLVLYGRGAPDLRSRDTRAGPSHLAALTEELYRRGVRRVRGSVVGDESYFRGETLGDGWLWQDAQWYYGAQPSALSVDDNEITVSVAPGGIVNDPAVVTLVPASDDVHVTNDMKTVERGARPAIGITRETSSNEVRVWGEFPAGGSPYSVRLSVYRPALHAARLFREALRARGIEVSGEARMIDARMRQEARLDPARAVELASINSRPLGEVVRETDKESLNLQAELLLRAIGSERGVGSNNTPSTKPDADAAAPRLRNTDEIGLAVVRRWLEEQARVRVENLALHDGSGLSRLDLVTPEATTRLLARISQTASADIFRDALPVAGRDGTLAYRMRGTPAADQVEAKTGALTYVNALSGYAQTADGELLAFSIICNDNTRPASSTRAIDIIAALLASYPQIKPEK